MLKLKKFYPMAQHFDEAWGRVLINLAILQNPGKLEAELLQALGLQLLGP